jgi:PPOX class probable FMN-dependent enzyme
MSEWVEELSRALQEEFADQPHVCTLATVDKNGTPRARSVVCRRVGTDGSLWFASDARSEKAEQLKAVPQAEIVFWLPTRREQFRLLGSVKVLPGAANDPVRLELWRAMSDPTRATFFWPSPGARRIDPPESFATAVDASAAPPPHFEVLIVRPRRVEQLQVGVHPHRRRRWMLAGNWSAAAEVNP